MAPKPRIEQSRMARETSAAPQGSLIGELRPSFQRDRLQMSRTSLKSACSADNGTRELAAVRGGRQTTG